MDLLRSVISTVATTLTLRLPGSPHCAKVSRPVRRRLALFGDGLGLRRWASFPKSLARFGGPLRLQVDIGAFPATFGSRFRAMSPADAAKFALPEARLPEFFGTETGTPGG
jgi:hypothetical protein